MTIDRRTQARELAMQALCQLDVQGEDIFAWLGRFFREQCDDAMTIQLAEQWTKGAWEKVNCCDEHIERAAAQWKLSRMSQVDRNVLRLAVYQLGYCPDIPGKVIINEAIEMARKYSTEQSPRFINGVLDAVLKQLRPGGAAPSVAASGKEEGKEESGELS
ncbi:MAG: transcription antitermination factor NusB [Planctomycetes bacterium]|nr:transcription antitermination factor NusB [Planctomycetota bacterium]